MFDLVYRYDPTKPSDRPAPADAAEAGRQLLEGNQRFATLASGIPDGRRIVYVDLEDIGVSDNESVLKQQPFAVVLGCSDARAPTELIFDRACNELFVVRVAGNVLGQDQLGSIDYAVEHLGHALKLLVVLGHSQCGAVTAAVDAFLQPAEYLGLDASHHVRAIVNSLFPAVHGAAAALSAVWDRRVSQRSGYRAALIETSVVLNAALTAAILREEFGGRSPDYRILFGVYDLHSRRVHVPQADDSPGEPAIRLLEAPAGREAFQQFDLAVASSPRVRALLKR